MENDPRRRRSRGGRRRGGGGGPERRPTRAPAEPKPPQPARGLARRDRPQRRRGAAAPRSPDELRSGTPCVIVMDCREGEPDRTGAAAVFEGFFDLETGEPRRSGFGVPRLRVEEERLWGFECWWRTDTERAGLTEADRLDLETSKRLLRGLLRDARRSTRPIR